MPLTLRLRNLETGALLLGEFEDVAQARAWLLERPRFMEVIGVVASTLDEAAAESLRQVVRPLDPDERERADALDEQRLDRLRQEIARQQAAFEAEAAAQRAQIDADPSRPMVIAYDRHEGLGHEDPGDPREIPDVVRDAVLAWVAERNSWVHPRRQRVVRAVVTVWPAAIPSGDEADRVQPGGKFDVEAGLD